MWVTSASQTFLPTPIPSTPFLSFQKLPQLPPETSFSAQISRRHRYPAVAAASSSPQDIGGLGQAVISTMKSGPSRNMNPSKKVEQEEKPKQGKEISGSDILRALQKANAKKADAKKNKRKKKGWGDSKTVEDGKKVVDFDKVRPFTINSDWATRLDDLQKRIQDFSTL